MDVTTLELRYDDERPASVALVDGLRTLEDPNAVVDELEFTLYDYVDPEALDALLADGSGDGDLVVSFSVDGYRVIMTNAGRVRIRTHE
ncbi:HalOD1 output domain-containing protein [Natrinema salaciae]|uniref:Halobacterial output domain-containing protein n=1 Tax=Natrinema salaciae TaxID=1186196 RepID=A0A1H9RBL0_9EURY|nr:HalOD1 output domain-containing protein [Natrinema salaciae]SER69313.1 hypothetical protein SAMN04489841_4321 [Natrinema salaciae]